MKSLPKILPIMIIAAVSIFAAGAGAFVVEYQNFIPQGDGCDLYDVGLMNFDIADPDDIPGTWGCEGLSFQVRVLAEAGDPADPEATFFFEYGWQVQESGVGMAFADCDFDFAACGLTASSNVFVTEPGSGTETVEIFCPVEYGVWYTVQHLTLFQDADYVHEWDPTGLPLSASCHGEFTSSFVSVVFSGTVADQDRTWGQIKALYR